VTKFAIKRIQLRTSLKKAFRLLLFIFAPLALPLQSFAEDQSNAALVDQYAWLFMYQVMSGTSKMGTPDSLPNPVNILTPQGLYVIIDANYLYNTVAATAAAKVSGQDQAFYNYLNFILNQPGVAGIMFGAPWSMLNPNDPNNASTQNSDAVCPSATAPSTTSKPNDAAAYVWNALDIAFCAISANPTKTLQLDISSGANSPGWLFTSYLTSCDFLFSTKPKPTNAQECGYTEIFKLQENATTATMLPMPWNSTYKTQLTTFLTALNGHIKKQSAQNFVVSINVTGPTMFSGEMILPRETLPVSCPKSDPSCTTLPSGYLEPSGPFHGGAGKATAQGNAAWNCLFANYYGSTPTPTGAYYLNTDRPFIEEWAAAIDNYGQIFSGLTLTVATGNGLPNFSHEEAGTVKCGGPGQDFPISAPIPIGPPPAFAPDCDVQPPNTIMFPMDCAAEAAILAYFAEPSVGGQNAKATQEDALAASDNVAKTLLTLSNASVKWLSQITTSGLETVPGPPILFTLSTGTLRPVVSRMLGGLQFAGPAVTLPSPADKKAGIPPTGHQKVGCTDWPTPCTISPEQSLLAVLQMFFNGTSQASLFSPPLTLTPFTNNGTLVFDAPVNYLQIEYEDVEYAAGWGNCDRALIMQHSLTDLVANATTICPYNSKTGDGPYTNPLTMPRVPVGYNNLTAQGLLLLAGKNIPTSAVGLPLFGYNSNNPNPLTATVCGCQSPYVQRGAFLGDDVCVMPTPDQSDAKGDNGQTTRFSLNYSTGSIYYGVCKAPYVWRQAYMGDYICVSQSHALEIARDNQAGKSHSTCPSP
jgi:hypothetical protein